MARHYIELRSALVSTEQEELQAEDGQEPPQESTLRRVYNCTACASGLHHDHPERKDHDSVALILADKVYQEAKHARLQDTEVNIQRVDGSKRRQQVS